MSWEQTVKEKITELELIASWASIVQLGKVRDAIRTATFELRKELERFPQSMEEDMMRTGLFNMPLDEASKFVADSERQERETNMRYYLRKEGIE